MNSKFLVNLSDPVSASINNEAEVGTRKHGVTGAHTCILQVCVNEGNSGTTPAVFTVSLAGATQLPVTVSYATADGIGKAGTDYQSVNGNLTLDRKSVV